MLDPETRAPMPPARLPRMILEDRYTGLLDGAVRPARLQGDLDRVLRGLLEGLVRQPLTEAQGAVVVELETLLHQAIVDRVATWDLPA